LRKSTLFAALARREFRASLECLAPVEISETFLTREQLRDMYAQHQAFVLPTKGEGFGLPIAEVRGRGALFCIIVSCKFIFGSIGNKFRTCCCKLQMC
jgi:hypothetical protein